MIVILGLLLLPSYIAIMTQAYRQSYLNSHPELDYQTRGDIESGTIRIGMTKEQVQASWGDRNAFCDSYLTAADGTLEFGFKQWEFHAINIGRQLYIFQMKVGVIFTALRSSVGAKKKKQRNLRT